MYWKHHPGGSDCPQPPAAAHAALPARARPGKEFVRMTPAGRTVRGEDTAERCRSGMSRSAWSTTAASPRTRGDCRARPGSERRDSSIHPSLHPCRPPRSACEKRLALSAEEGLQVPLNLAPAFGNPRLPSSAGPDAARLFRAVPSPGGS